MSDQDEMFGGSHKPGKNKTGGTSLKAGKPANARPGTEAYQKWVDAVHIAQSVASRMTMVGEKTIAEMRSEDRDYQDACAITGAGDTRRQFSKWRRGNGAARSQLRKKLNDKLGALEMKFTQLTEDLRTANKAVSHFNAEEFIGKLEFEKDDETLSVEQVEEGFEGTLEEYKEELSKRYLAQLVTIAEEVEKSLKSIETDLESFQPIYKRLIKKAR